MQKMDKGPCLCRGRGRMYELECIWVESDTVLISSIKQQRCTIIPCSKRSGERGVQIGILAQSVMKNSVLYNQSASLSSVHGLTRRKQLASTAGITLYTVTFKKGKMQQAILLSFVYPGQKGPHRWQQRWGMGCGFQPELAAYSTIIPTLSIFIQAQVVQDICSWGVPSLAASIPQPRKYKLNFASVSFLSALYTVNPI